MAACAIVSGYTIDCRDSVGGIDAVYFAEFGNVTTAQKNTNGIVAVYTPGSNQTVAVGLYFSTNTQIVNVGSGSLCAFEVR